MPHNSTKTPTTTAGPDRRRRTYTRTQNLSPGHRLFIKESTRLVSSWKPKKKKTEEETRKIRYKRLLRKLYTIHPFLCPARQNLGNVLRYMLMEWDKELERWGNSRNVAPALPKAMLFISKTHSKLKKPRDIASLIFYLGKFAKSERLAPAQKRCVLQLVKDKDIRIRRLLARIANHGGNAQDIGAAILGLGYIARQGVQIKIRPVTLDSLLENLSDDGNSRAISTALLGLGYIAKQGAQIKIRPVTLDSLLRSLSIRGNSRAISTALLALGYIAKQGVQIVICPETLDSLLRSLSIRGNSRDIASALLGLGYIAQQSVQIVVRPETLDSFLRKLLVNGGSQAIANAILSLGCIVQQNSQIYMDSKLVKEFLKRFLNLNPTTQHIANTLLGFGHIMLSQKKGMPIHIDSEPVNALLKKLLLGNPTSEEIGSALYACCWLLTIPNLDRQAIENLTGRLLSIIDQASAETIRQVAYALFGIDQPIPQKITARLKPPSKFSPVQKALCEEFQDRSVVQPEALIGPCFVDVFLPKQKTIVELDGKHHYDRKGNLRPRDVKRDQHLTKRGYTVVRFWHCKDRIDKIRSFIQQQLTHSASTNASVEHQTPPPIPAERRGEKRDRKLDGEPHRKKQRTNDISNSKSSFFNSSCHTSPSRHSSHRTYQEQSPHYVLGKS